MNILKIVSMFIFPVALSSYQLTREQRALPLSERVGMFRSEVFIMIVDYPSFIVMIISGILIFLDSWKLLIGLFFGTAIVYPLFGRFIVTRTWLIPYYFLNKWVRKRLKDE